MPLWLQAIVETVLMTVASLAVVLVLLLCGWASIGFPGGVEPVLGGAGQLWLAAHGVGLHLDVAGSAGLPGVSGVATLTPLGLTLLLLFFARRAGSRLAQASYEGQFWQPVLSSAVTYGVLSAVISLATGSRELSTNVFAAAVVPVWVVLVGAVWGGHRVSGSWLRLIGIRREALVERYNQYTRWAGAYIACVLRAGWVGLLGVVAGGALLTGAAILYQWNDVVALQQALHAGLLGDAVLTLVQLALLPNLVVFGMAWSLGAGFSLGEGTAISPAVTDAAGLPGLPLLGALPAGTGPWSFAVLALPVLAGALAGWWFVRAGENHLDEWLSLKIRFRWLSALLSGLALALAVGLLVGVGTGVLAALARGSLGVGRFDDVGPDPLLTGLWTLATVGLGALIGQVLSPLLEREAGARAPGPSAGADGVPAGRTAGEPVERSSGGTAERTAGASAAASAGAPSGSPAEDPSVDSDEGPLPGQTPAERRRAARRERRALKAAARRERGADSVPAESPKTPAASAAASPPSATPEAPAAGSRNGEDPSGARPSAGEGPSGPAAASGERLTALERLRGAREPRPGFSDLPPVPEPDGAEPADREEPGPAPLEPWAGPRIVPSRDDDGARNAAGGVEGGDAGQPTRGELAGGWGGEEPGEKAPAVPVPADAQPADPRADAPGTDEALAGAAAGVPGDDDGTEPPHPEPPHSAPDRREDPEAPEAPSAADPRPEPKRIVVARPRRRRRS